MDDASTISQVILKERQGRDRGWFDQQAACFHPHSRVHITWFNGPGVEFVELSRAAYAEGIRPSHRLAPPVVHQNLDRAVVEVPTEISVVQNFGGVEATIVSNTRLLYRMEKIGQWGITGLDCIYERDTLVPVVVGTTPQVEQDVLRRFRRPFMYLAYHLNEVGRPVRDDLYADDRPSDVDALYDAAFNWLDTGAADQ